MNRSLPFVAWVAVFVLAASSVQAQDKDAAMVARARPAVDRGVAFLKGQSTQLKDAGEAGVSALALVKAGVAPNDPAFVNTVARFSGCFTEKGYLPQSRGGPDTYEAGAVELGGHQWLNHLRFRDLLRSSSDARDTYEVEKLRLAEQHGNDRPAYTEGKTHVVTSLLAGLRRTRSGSRW